MSDSRSALKLLCRKQLHSLIVACLRLRSRPFHIEGQGLVSLVIAPHPDDEALGCAVLIHARRSLGLPVHVLYLTDGAASHPGHPSITPAQLAVRRKTEARAAMRLLGVPDDCLHFAGAADGRLGRLSSDETTALLGTIETVFHRVSPTDIFLPYRYDGSSEHIAAFALVQRALIALAHRPRIWEFPVWSWWSPRLLLRPLWSAKRIHRLDTRQLRALKERALRCYLTQIEPLEPDTAPVLSEGFLKFFTNFAEYYFETYADVSPSSSSPASRS